MAIYRCAGRKRFDGDGIPYCNYESDMRWIGICPNCRRPFNCDKIGPDKQRAKTTLASAVESNVYMPTGITGFDTVIGGGLVEGSVILFGGSRGAGKTTLLLSVADGFSGLRKRPVLYASGEETQVDVIRTAQRLGMTSERVEVMGNACDIEEIIERAKLIKPALAIFDSLQVMTCADVKGSEASTAQAIAVANIITSHCKRSNMCGIIVNHVTKTGEFAGSVEVEHLVDTIAMLDHFPFDLETGEVDDENENIRMLEIVGKNRKGPSDKKVYFEMTAEGLKPVRKKSRLHLA